MNNQPVCLDDIIQGIVDARCEGGHPDSVQSLVPAVFALRSKLRDAYRTAHGLRARNAAALCESALACRMARLQRDWFKSRVDADVRSYDSIHWDFDPDDLMSAHECTLLAANSVVVTPDTLEKRCEQEILCRLRTLGRVTQKQGEQRRLVAQYACLLDVSEQLATRFNALHSDFLAYSQNLGILQDSQMRTPSPIPSELI